MTVSAYRLLQMLPERREAGQGVDELLDEIGACEFERVPRALREYRDFNRTSDLLRYFTPSAVQRRFSLVRWALGSVSDLYEERDRIIQHAYEQFGGSLAKLALS